MESEQTLAIYASQTPLNLPPAPTHFVIVASDQEKMVEMVVYEDVIRLGNQCHCRTCTGTHSASPASWMIRLHRIWSCVWRICLVMFVEEIIPKYYCGYSHQIGQE
jgi:hypothetical protein